MVALAAALTGPPGVLVAEMNSTAAFNPPEYAQLAETAPLPWDAVPDSPPPRA